MISNGACPPAIMVNFSKSSLHVLYMRLPVHETARSSHWVGAPTVTLNARTAERKKAIYRKERRRGDGRILCDKVRRGCSQGGEGRYWREGSGDENPLRPILYHEPSENLDLYQLAELYHRNLA
jgi:hypothetical protein